MLFNKFIKKNTYIHNPLEQRPSWEVKWFSASQKILRILGNPKINYCIHFYSPPIYILSQTNHHTSSSHFSRAILRESSHLFLGLTSGLFPSGLPPKTPYALLLSLPNVPYAPPISLFFFSNHPNNISWGVQIMQTVNPDKQINIVNARFGSNTD